jgi:hypothetical protein
MSKICPILSVDSLEHKEKLYFLDQHQNSNGLHVINSRTNSNLNLPRILKGSNLSGKSDKFSKILSSHSTLEYEFTLPHLYSNIGSSFTSGKKVLSLFHTA